VTDNMRETEPNTEWKKVRLGDLAEVYLGLTYTPSYVSEGVPFLSVKDINGGKINFKDTRFISRNEFTNSTSNAKPQKGDILFGRVGTLGNPIIVEDDIEFCIFVSLGFLRIYKERVLNYYIAHWMSSKIFSKQIESKVAGSSQKNLNTGWLKEFQLYLPPFPEQHKISTTLSTWDKAIELKEKLIDLKKEQKKGLMQRILTGMVRLPQFNGEWTETKLGSVLKERNETGSGHLELLSITAKSGVVKRTEVDIKDNSNENKDKYKRICPLDIGYNTMRMWQGVSGVSKYEGIVSPAYTVLKPTDKVDSYFIGYLFKLPRIVNLFWRHSQGLVDDTLNLKYSNFKDIMVNMPVDIKEQKAIASLLRVLDKEIVIHNKELELLKQQKKGLMQLLLTGKVRVQC